jgi:hypothetical protein
MAKLRLLDLFRSAQDRLAGNAFGQAMRGMLGIESIPCLRTCFYSNAMLLGDDARAYARHQERAFHRKPDTREVRPGNESKIGSGFRLVRAFQRLVHSTRTLYQGSSHRTLIGYLVRCVLSTLWSNAICCIQREKLSQTGFRIGGNNAFSGPFFPSFESTKTFSCSQPNTTLRWLDLARMGNRRIRNASMAWS